MADLESGIDDLLASGRVTVSDVEHTLSLLATQKELDTIMVKPKDLPVCVGNEGLPCQGANEFRIKGFDDKQRCTMCHRLFMELVRKHVGDRKITPTSGCVKAKPKSKEHDAARRKILADKGELIEGGWGQNPMDLYPDRKVVAQGASLGDLVGKQAGEQKQVAHDKSKSSSENMLDAIRSKYVR
jgi:hypothetical protein